MHTLWLQGELIFMRSHCYANKLWILIHEYKNVMQKLKYKNVFLSIEKQTHKVEICSLIAFFGFCLRAESVCEFLMLLLVCVSSRRWNLFSLKSLLVSRSRKYPLWVSLRTSVRVEVGFIFFLPWLLSLCGFFDLELIKFIHRARFIVNDWIFI